MSLLGSFVWWKKSKWKSEQGAKKFEETLDSEKSHVWYTDNMNTVTSWNQNHTERKSYMGNGNMTIQLLCQGYSSCHPCPSHRVRTIWIWSALCDSLSKGFPFFSHSPLRGVTVPTIRSNFSPSLSSEPRITQISAAYYTRVTAKGTNNVRHLPTLSLADKPMFGFSSKLIRNILILKDTVVCTGVKTIIYKLVIHIQIQISYALLVHYSFK